MIAKFPAHLYTERETENLNGLIYNSSDKKNLYSEDFQRHASEIIAIETILGINPQGSHDSVVDRFTSLETILDITSLVSNEILMWDGLKLVSSAIFEDSGNIGIGRVPTDNFDVLGNVNITGIYRVDGNTALWLSSNGSSIGLGCIPSIFNGNYSGGNSFFAGNLAGARMGAGTENFLMGSLSGWNITDGGFNVGIGTSSLRSNVHGNQNVAIGWGALYHETGSANVAIGYQAGSALTTGNYNVCIGANAGLSATAGISLSLMLGRNANATTSNVCVIGGIGSDALSVVVGGTEPNANAIMDLISSTKAFMPPRMTTTQKNAIASPTAGMVVFDSTLGKLCVYSTTWQTITSI